MDMRTSLRARLRPRRAWPIILSSAAAVATVAVLTVIQPANAATVFSANFEDGSISTWSKSGGEWAVITDGSKAVRQSNTSSGNARLFNAASSLTDYTVSARVKPVSLGSAGFTGLLARVESSTRYYRLALLPGNQVQLQAVNGSTSTILGSTSRTIANGTWYTLSITTQGSTISASIDGTQFASASSSYLAAGRIGLQTAYSSASFDDVLVTTGGTSSPSPSSSVTASASASSSASPTASTSQPPAGTLYVAPNGSDSAPGTLSSPTTLISAITRITSGGTIFMRGGTYNFSQTVAIAPGNNGTSSARKKIAAYAGETPVLNFSAQTEDPANRGLAVNGNFWHIHGLIVERAGDNGIFIGGSNNIIERTITRFNRDSGLQISRIVSTTPYSQWPANNLVLTAESHDNADSDGEDADGFAAKLTVGPGNVFRHTVSHHNIDDGWDLFTYADYEPIGTVTIEDSLSYKNGTLSDGSQAGAGDRNGYKLGGSNVPINHIVRRSIAFDNGKHGFTYNSNPGTMTISNNISIDNDDRNFQFDAGTSVFRNNTSCRFSSGTNDRSIGDADSSNQFWAGTNGSRCTNYSGALSWSFAADGRLVVTLGGRVVTP